MQSLRFRPICLICLAAILIIIAGCEGLPTSAGNSPSNPSNPGTQAPGGNPGGGGNGGTPHSARTFVYFTNGNPFSSPAANTLVFKLNGDGTLIAGSSFSDPNIIFGQSSKFLIGVNGNSSALGPTVYSVNTQTGVPQSQVSHVKDGGGVTDGATLYTSVISTGGGVDAYSISSTGQLSLVPGSPFDAAPSGAFFNKSYASFQIVGSLLFADFNTVKDAGNITVFSRAANGALTRKFDFGNGDTPFGYVVHPTTRFGYVVSDISNLDVYSLDMNSNSATRIQQVSDPSGSGFVILDPAGKFLFLHDNGVREFSIDQGSGKLTEISGSPLASDNSIRDYGFDPSGRFLIVVH